jgi:hypothetical protein
MSTPAPQQGKTWQSLLDQGWRQGTLFTGPGLSFNFNLLENAYFVVDPPNCLVATAYLRVHIKKDALSALAPKPWPGSTERRERFARWLARRYDRPPFPDVLVEAFVSPLQQILERMDETEYGAALHRVTREWRLSAPASDDPPYEVKLVLLLDTSSLSTKEADALGIVEEQLRSVLYPTVIMLHPVIRMATPNELSVREYWMTFPIYAEYLSYQGDDAIGALPLPRL